LKDQPDHPEGGGNDVETSCEVAEQLAIIAHRLDVALERMREVIRNADL